VSVIQTGIFTLIKRFPEHMDSLKLLYRESETFHTICEDYRRCTEALKRWDQSASEDAPALRVEYKDLLHDLELEILQYLNELSQRKLNEKI